jgi:hypothetical protein
MCRYSRVHYRLINILLVIAGILLALALFGAGAVWKGKMQPSRPSVSAPAADHHTLDLRGVRP